MSALLGLQCHLCKATFPAETLWVCEKCLGPLEPYYDYKSITVTRDEIVQQRVRAARAVGSPAYPGDEDEIAARAGLAYDRSHDPIGIARQAIATVASGDRTERLRYLKVPTLVIHGLADRMR